jgi:ATP-dependent Lhr-like helicase
MDNPCRPGDRIILGGNRWEAIEVDNERAVVIVCPARGGKTPDYTGSPLPIHRRLVQEMHSVLSSHDIPRFIDAASRNALAQARQAWTGMSLDKLSILPHESDSLIFLQLGGRESNYLRLALGSQGFEAWSPHPIALQVAGISPTRLKRQLSILLEKGLPDPERLAEESAEYMLRAKYDSYLPRNLLAHDWASEFLSRDGIEEEILRLTEE